MRTDRRRAPAPGPRKPIQLPVPESTVLDNGLQVVMLVERRLPLLALDWILPAGADQDPPDRAGRTALTTGLLDEGTRRRRGPELAGLIESLGGSLGTSTDWDASYAGCSILGEHRAVALDLLIEVVREPAFAPAEVERCRQQTLDRLLQRRDRPAVLANDHVAALLYRGTPYGAPLAGLPETVAAFGPEDLAAHGRSQLAAHPQTLIAVGDFDPPALLTRLGELPRLNPGTRGPAPQVDALPRRAIRILDRPQATQTELRVAQPGPPRSDPDWAALRLLSILLGGMFTSRLMRVLREERGLTYGASAAFSTRRGQGPFVTAAAVDSEGVGSAVEAILGELQDLRERPPAAAELNAACDYYVGVVPQRLESCDDLAGQIAGLVIYELGLDYFRRLEALHRAVRPTDVRDAAARHLRPETAAIVAVGPAALLEPQLKAFGDVEVLPAA